MDKLPEWDASKADDPQYMMNMAKKFVIMDTLTANGGECTFEALFAKSEELHCDVLTAALGSMKRKKVVGYDSEMPLLHPKDNAGGVLTSTALTAAPRLTAPTCFAAPQLSSSCLSPTLTASPDSPVKLNARLPSTRQ